MDPRDSTADHGPGIPRQMHVGYSVPIAHQMTHLMTHQVSRQIQWYRWTVISAHLIQRIRCQRFRCTPDSTSDGTPDPVRHISTPDPAHQIQRIRCQRF